MQGPQRGKVGVSLVRCRQVTKPSGAKAGLVQLNGDVSTVKVDVKAEVTCNMAFECFNFKYFKYYLYLIVLEYWDDFLLFQV